MAGAGVPQLSPGYAHVDGVSSSFDKYQRVRHLSSNCQGSKGPNHGQAESPATQEIERALGGKIAEIGTETVGRSIETFG